DIVEIDVNKATINKGGMLYSGKELTITSFEFIVIDGELFSTAKLSVSAKKVNISGKVESVKDINLVANTIRLANGYVKSNDVINLHYNEFTSTNSTIKAGGLLTLQHNVLKGCLIILSLDSKLIGGEINLASNDCP